MKTIFVVALSLLFTLSANAQEDMINKIAQQAVQIDSLKRVVGSKQDSLLLLRAILNNYQDTAGFYRQQYPVIDSLKAQKVRLEETCKSLLAVDKSRAKELEKCEKDIGKLEKYRAEMDTHESLLKQKDSAIAYLQNDITNSKKLLSEEKQRSINIAKEEKEAGKKEALSKLIDSYRNKAFDLLVKESTQLTVRRDMELIGSNTDVKSIMDDLMKYYSAEAVLTTKFDAAKLKFALDQLNSLNQNSSSINQLKVLLEDYQVVNEGLKEMIGKLKILDVAEESAGMPRIVQQKKLGKVMTEISNYIFNYGFNIEDYPYLSTIIFEIMKRKQPNPDADISDLLKKL